MSITTLDFLSGISDSAQSFKALGDETRLRMVGLLRHGELCVCDLMEVLCLPQSTASRHLAYLKNSNWIVSRRRGKWMYYRLHPDLKKHPMFNSIVEYIFSLAELQKEYDSLLIYLDQKDGGVQCS